MYQGLAAHAYSDNILRGWLPSFEIKISLILAHCDAVHAIIGISS